MGCGFWVVGDGDGNGDGWMGYERWQGRIFVERFWRRNKVIQILECV